MRKSLIYSVVPAYILSCLIYSIVSAQALPIIIPPPPPDNADFFGVHNLLFIDDNNESGDLLFNTDDLTSNLNNTETLETETTIGDNSMRPIPTSSNSDNTISDEVTPSEHEPANPPLQNDNSSDPALPVDSRPNSSSSDPRPNNESIPPSENNEPMNPTVTSNESNDNEVSNPLTNNESFTENIRPFTTSSTNSTTVFDGGEVKKNSENQPFITSLSNENHNIFGHLVSLINTRPIWKTKNTPILLPWMTIEQFAIAGIIVASAGIGWSLWIFITYLLNNFYQRTQQKTGYNLNGDFPKILLLENFPLFMKMAAKLSNKLQDAQKPEHSDLIEYKKTTVPIELMGSKKLLKNQQEFLALLISSVDLTDLQSKLQVLIRLYKQEISELII